MKRLIIRADDLGYSEAVNHGIAGTVKDGLIGSVGIMLCDPEIRRWLAQKNVVLCRYSDI